MRIRAIATKLPPSAKRFLKTVCRQTVGRMPPPRERLAGKLAKNGGLAVRDVRFRPWPSLQQKNLIDWITVMRPRFREIFLSGIEGLPQPLGKQFAQEWAKYCGCRYGLLLPHGTDALRIALAATLDHDGLSFGGEVIVPNYSFIASANAALDRRFGIVLVDVDPQTLNLDPKRVEEAIVPGKTRAIMAVHLFGQPADMSALRAIAQKHSLRIIEDAAQAHGAIHELGRAGSLGDVAGFSFQSFKNISSGEGGALTTNDAAIFERAWQLHNVGRTRLGGQRWGHESLGWNCRPTEYIAAVLLHRLSALEEQQVRRHSNYMLLREMLRDIPCAEFIGIGSGVIRHGLHMAAFRYRATECGNVSIDDFCGALSAEGIPVGRAYPNTISQQPVFQKLMTQHPDYVRAMPTPIADRAVNEILQIGHNVFLGTEADMKEIAAAFRKVQEHYVPKVWRADLPSPRAKASAAATPGITNKRIPVRDMECIRCGLIGFGAMGKIHAAVLQASPSVTLVAVTDMQPNARVGVEKLGVQWFASPEALIQSKKVEAVIIATPHWQHAALAIAGLRAGLHVICEKPLTVTVSQADAVLQAAAESKSVFAAVHQTRFEPAYQFAKRLLVSGELGPIQRCSIVESMWRTEAYYRSSPWRGTWKGEGGGVLLNQAPHVLDRYAWLCGMPETVLAYCTTLLHSIEVEDAASAILRHKNGAQGYLHVSTNECPSISETVIACDRGRIVINNGRVEVSRLRDSIREVTEKDGRMWGDLASETQTLPGNLVNSFQDLLGAFYENFAQAVQGAAALVSPGVEARNAVELANAMILSSSNNAPVTLPINRAAYDQLMAIKTANRAA